MLAWHLRKIDLVYDGADSITLKISPGVRYSNGIWILDHRETFFQPYKYQTSSVFRSLIVFSSLFWYFAVFFSSWPNPPTLTSIWFRCWCQHRPAKHQQNLQVTFSNFSSSFSFWRKNIRPKSPSKDSAPLWQNCQTSRRRNWKPGSATSFQVHVEQLSK